MAWLKKGLCGVDLKKQTIVIAVIFMFISLAAMIMGFVIIDRPELFMDARTKAAIHWQKENQARAQDDSYGGNSSTETTEWKLSEDIVRDVQREGVEVVIGALITLFFTSMLIYGVRQAKSVWMLPWLVQQTTELCIGFGMLLVRIVVDGNISFAAISVSLVFTIVGAYVLWSVFSYYVMLRRMKKHSDTIISSVMDSTAYTSGVNYERLQEEIVAKEMTPMPPIRERPRVEDNDTRRDDIAYFSI